MTGITNSRNTGGGVELPYATIACITEDLIGEEIRCIGEGYDKSLIITEAEKVFFTVYQLGIYEIICNGQIKTVKVTEWLEKYNILFRANFAMIDVKIYGAKDDVIDVYDANNIFLETIIFPNRSTQTQASIPIPSSQAQNGSVCVFKSRKMKSFDDETQAYEKAITISKDTTDVYVRPHGVISWGGYLNPNFVIENVLYTMGGRNWFSIERIDEYAVMQLNGSVGISAWPGYVLGGTLTNGTGETVSIGNANTGVAVNIDGYDISHFNTNSQNIYQAIKSMEKTGVYGKGLYLLSNAAIGNPGDSAKGTGVYWRALLRAALSSGGNNNSRRYVWLGTMANNSYALDVVAGISDESYSVRSYSRQNSAGNNDMNVTLTFNLDLRKAKLEGTAISLIDELTT